MSESRFERLTSYSSRRETLVKASLVAVIGFIAAVLAPEYCGVLTVQIASLIVSSLLATATFAYVLPTYSTGPTMQDEMQYFKRSIQTPSETGHDQNHSRRNRPPTQRTLATVE
ncbi:MAG: hypothetical protein ABEI86_05690 [Halobacteriaceae archaeon]